MLLRPHTDVMIRVGRRRSIPPVLLHELHTRATSHDLRFVVDAANPSFADTWSECIRYGCQPWELPL